MKKVTIMLLAAVFLLVLPVQPAAAATDFSLVNGQLAAQDQDLLEDEHLFKDFFSGLQISAAYSSQQDKYTLSGTNSVEKSGQDGNISYVLNCSGDIAGVYDPLTGGFDGTFHYEMSETDKSGGITMTDALFDMDGEFTAIGDPDDTQIKITFHGVNKRLEGYTKEYFFDVTFAVQGALPFTQEPTPEPEETMEPEETHNYMQELLDRVKTPPEDHGMRFSDLSGQVEVLIPLGYDANGEPVWDEEAWQFAELDMVLPVGTSIKTSDNSSAIISFPSSEPLVMKPESHIFFPKSKEVSQLKLLTGNLWVNVKKMLKDGSMDIEMSQAVAGIKGTTFVLEDDGETSTLKVIEGTVEFTSKATGESVMVDGGEAVSATAGGLAEIGTFNVDAEMAGWAEYGAKMPAEGLPLWAILAIGGGALVIVLVVVIAVASRRKNRPAAATHPIRVKQA